VTWEERASNGVAAEVVAASAEEIQRAARHGTDPNQRFHYRYQATLLAWEAAKLMPNNSDETARMLCTAGSWLKQRDPETADFFYKMLVRRCRKTAIGDQADRMRWFPVLDEAGNPLPWKPRLETIAPPAPGEIPPDDETSGDYPLPGKPYIIHRGDSLADIARAVTALGTPVTVKEILAANDGLNVAQLQIGQKILIPSAKAAVENTTETPVP
jgi:nucleoid-associated protein YgaU